MPSHLQGPALAGALLAIGCTPLVEDVPTDVCASGGRWIGQELGHEHMHPGRDCIACHDERDGPSFFAAGTVYGIYDDTGEVTVDNECFGLPGVKVTLRGADGAVFETFTNPAGNFFFEGPHDRLVKPYHALVEYVLADGHVSRQAMHSSPSYGGCAHCHGTTSARTTERCPGGVLRPAEVFPVTPIFSGPVADGPLAVPQSQECEP